MSTKHILRSELHALAVQPEIRFSSQALPRIRLALDEQYSRVALLPDGVTREDVLIESQDGYEIPCLLYRPATQKEPTAGFVHFHGGGYIIGSADMSDESNINLVQTLGIIVLSVNYRLAPEHPIPTPLEDCYAALIWLHAQSGALNIDATRIGVGGESAGGGLAAAVAIRARDDGRFPICHQHLTFPMLDDRTGSEETPCDPLVGEFVWTRANNQFAWTSYLDGQTSCAPYVPARLTDFRNLPPAWIHTVTLDLFRDENILYARQLMATGVSVELEIFPGACHGYQRLTDTKAGQLYRHRYQSALARGLKVSSKTI